MKKGLSFLLAVFLICSLSACGAKDAVQEKTREVLDGLAENQAPVGGDSAAGGATPAGAISNPAEGYDAEYLLYVGGANEWTPFQGKSDVSFVTSDSSVLSVRDNGAKISFTGKQVGESVITGTLDGTEVKALVRVRAMEGGDTWTLTIKEATVMDMMGLAVVDYDCDLIATHTGPDMFGVYTGELGMVYSADLSGMQEFLAASGVDMSYDTSGWFKNTDFRMELMRYTTEDENHFVDSLKDPIVTDEERALVNSYMGSMFAGVGSGDKDFEKANTPVGLWYDWAFHMTEGDMSAYVHMNSAMFSASASQDATAQNAEGYATAILAGSFHESLSYADQSPFPYQIVVYESGEAVLTLRSPTESPIVVKFYGTITKSEEETA